MSRSKRKDKQARFHRDKTTLYARESRRKATGKNRQGAIDEGLIHDSDDDYDYEADHFTDQRHEDG